MGTWQQLTPEAAAAAAGGFQLVVKRQRLLSQSLQYLRPHQQLGRQQRVLQVQTATSMLQQLQSLLQRWPQMLQPAHCMQLLLRCLLVMQMHMTAVRSCLRQHQL
jgi:hypothetical protein